MYLLYEVERPGWEKKLSCLPYIQSTSLWPAYLTELRCRCVWVGQGFEGFLIYVSFSWSQNTSFFYIYKVETYGRRATRARPTTEPWRVTWWGRHLLPCSRAHVFPDRRASTWCEVLQGTFTRHPLCTTTSKNVASAFRTDPTSKHSRVFSLFHMIISMFIISMSR